MLAAADDLPVLRVSDLTRQARLHIEQRFNLVWVQGELSNFRRPGSGHWYFTLKDEQAQLRCAMFANRNRGVRVRPTDGMEVLLRGRLSLYEPRGDFQLIAEHLEAAGEGALRAAFDALKTRLQTEGLFAEEAKRPLPQLPAHLAIISSPTGAALHDVLHVVQRRFPSLAVTLVPAAVQGDTAEASVLGALEKAVALEPDAILLTRGGGSLEDLWTFNLESVARAVAACPIPIAVAVGHQTDFCIAEFAADLRAPTPSAAAELLTPNAAELSATVAHLQRRLQRSFTDQLRIERAQLAGLRGRLQDPRQRLNQVMQRTDELSERLARAMHHRISDAHARHQGLRRVLAQQHPAPLVTNKHRQLVTAHGRLQVAARNALQRQRQRWAAGARTLQAVSPLHTIGRGYSVLSTADHRWVTSIANVDSGDRLTAHLHDGALEVEVLHHDDDNRLPEVPKVAADED